jgi:serine/threonine protein kinase
MIGQVIGNRYEIQQQLGKKAGRRTLLARDMMTEALVVVKLLSFDSDFEWDNLKLFEREGETLKNLKHPAIPSYLNYFELNSSDFKGFALVQTYIPAQTLEYYLKGRTFTEAEVKEIAKAILEILIYLHGQKPPVIHRDIKPSNILLGDRSGNSVGQIYLIDFGSVQTVVAGEGLTRTVVGTYGYMPPEQFGGRTVPASDIYSLGATLIYLVTGIQPADLPQKDLRIQFEQVANLNPVLTDWLRWMVEPACDKRCSSAQQALQALEKPQLNNTVLLTVVNKPSGSKIKLSKNQDSLEIIIPSAGFNASTAFLTLFAIVWNSFILFWTCGVMLAPFPMNLPFLLFSLPFWGAGFSMVYTILFSIFGNTHLKINQQEISLTNNLLGLKFNRPPSSASSDISKLIYIPRTFTTNPEGERMEVPPQLVIWAGVHKYQLGGRNNFVESEPSMEWLASELSQWLGIPITQ